MYFGKSVLISGDWVRDLAYGENRRQALAALFRFSSATFSGLLNLFTPIVEDPLALYKFQQIDGADPGFVNMTDLDRVLCTMIRIVAGFVVNFNVVPHVCIGVKHGNACGAAISTDGLPNIEVLLSSMISGDAEDIFGGFIITNFPIDAGTATTLRRHEVLGDKPRILDGIIAPSVDAASLAVLKRKDNRCRVFVNPALARLNVESIDKTPDFRKIRGGALVQVADTDVLNLEASYIECHGHELSGQERRDLVLAWAIGSTSNSNNTVAVKDNVLIANAVGQQSRVGSIRLLKMKAIVAGHRQKLKGAVYYTNSFFPFVDAPKMLVRMGARVIFTSISPSPGRWSEIKELCIENGVTLIAGPDAAVRGFRNH